MKLFETCKQVAVFKIGNLFLKRSINKLNMQIMSTTSTIKRSRNSLIKKRFIKKIKLNQKYVCFPLYHVLPEQSPRQVVNNKSHFLETFYANLKQENSAEGRNESNNER